MEFVLPGGPGSPGSPLSPFTPCISAKHAKEVLKSYLKEVRKPGNGMLSSPLVYTLALAVYTD